MRKFVVLFAALATAMALAVPAGAGKIDIDGMEAAEVVADAYGIPGYEDRDAPRYLEGRSFNPGNTPAPRLDDSIRVFIQLDVPSVAELVGDRLANGQGTSKGQKNSQANKVNGQQAAFRADLSAFDVTERWSLQYGANGLVVDAKLGDLMAIQGLDGVLSIAPLTRHTVTNSTSVPWIGTEDLWNSGFDGDGIKIAIIDTGIDYYHANFGGSGDPLDYENDDPTIVEGGSFPTVKVAGGTDFVGDSYNASSSNPAINTPNPDDDPLDCHGHGSHVAGTAAGNGTADIGAGVAPAATLYALKVFGCDGSTDVTSLAIEWAIANDMDVINMSLGSDFGSPNDPSAIASNNAAAAGVIVVASAGNDGNVPYITGSPAVASDAISVAASIDGGYSVLGITYTVDEGGGPGAPVPVEAQESSFAPSLEDTGPVVADVVVMDDGTGVANDGCEPAVNSGEFAGKIVLIQRGGCAFLTKMDNGDVGGAVGIIVFNDAARGDGLVRMGPDATYSIPSLFIGNTGGQAMADAIGAGHTVEATMSLDIEIPKPELADFLAGFSSLGPGGGGTTFKPDLSAPGVGITSAQAGSGTGTLTIGGTSMAAPHIAGAAALLREQYPGMSVDAIKSLLMNSSVDAADGSSTTKQGVGVVRINAASELGAYTTPAGVSFGRLNPVSAGSATQTVTVNNFDNVARTYDISVDPRSGMSGVSVSADASVNVPAGGSATFDITVHYDPAAMPWDDGFHSHADIDGRVILSHADESLAVGYVAAIDAASAVTTSPLMSKGQVNRLAISNQSSTLGWIDMFTLVGQGVGGAAAIGVRTNDTFGVVEFGVAGNTAWDANSTRETDIYLDTDQDGNFDYVLVAADLGYLTGGDAAGVTVTALINLSGGASLQWFVTTDYNDAVQNLWVDRHGTFGFLDDGDYTFDFFVVTFDTRFGVDGLAAGSVNLQQQADKQANLAGALPPGAGGTFKLTPADRPTMLVIYQNNQVADQWEIIQLKPTANGGNPALPVPPGPPGHAGPPNGAI